jgi:predicted transposase YbfD/YdcC
MIDINTILTQALTTAVAEAMLPLQQEYANKMGEMATRIAALEAQLAQAAPAPQIDATKPLVERIAVLEKHTAVLDQHGGILEYLDNQEWFWEKISRYITNYSDITVDELHNIKQRLVELEAHEGNVYHYDKGAVESLIEEAIDAHLENANHLDEDDISSLIETAIDYHEENRTHGDEDDIEEMVQKLLNGATLSISV